MKYLCSILVPCFWVLIAHAQPLSGRALVDSLVKELNGPGYAEEDTNRVKLMNRIGFSFYEYNPDSGGQYGSNALKIAARIGWRPGIANAHNVIGVNSQVLGNNERALEQYLQALKINEEDKNEQAVARNIGNIATLYYGESNYVKALEYLFRALKIFERTGNDIGIARQYCNIGNIYEEQKDFVKAQHYDSLSLLFYRKVGDKAGEAIALGNLANAFSGLGLHMRSLQLNESALMLYKSLNNTDGIARSFLNISTNYIAMGNYRLALENQFAAREIYARFTNFRGLGLLHTNMAETYYNIAVNRGAGFGRDSLPGRQKCFELAIENARKAIEINTELHFLPSLAVSYKTLALAQKELGMHSASLENYIKYSSLKDSVYTMENKKKLLNLENQRQIELKESKIKLLEQNNKLKDLTVAKKSLANRMLAIGIALVMVIAFSSVMYFVRRQRAEKAIADEKVNTLLKEQELKSVSGMLEAQEQERKRIAADLHDRLGSMLSTIKLYFASVEDEVREESEQFNKASVLLDNAVDEVRKISHNLVAGELAKFGLVSALEQLQDTIVRTGKLKMEVYAYGLEERLSSSVEIGLYRVVQELMNNILKHAKANKVVIQLNRVDDNLNVVVEDDGVGFDVDAAIAKEGLGLKNMDARIKKLNGTISYDSGKGNGTTTVIDVPID